MEAGGWALPLPLPTGPLAPGARRGGGCGVAAATIHRFPPIVPAQPLLLCPIALHPAQPLPSASCPAVPGHWARRLWVSVQGGVARHGGGGQGALGPWGRRRTGLDWTAHQEGRRRMLLLVVLLGPLGSPRFSIGCQLLQHDAELEPPLNLRITKPSTHPHTSSVRATQPQNPRCARGVAQVLEPEDEFEGKGF